MGEGGPVRADLSRGEARVGNDRDAISGMENLLGTGFGDRLTGNDLPNRLEGGGGNDVLEGGAGGDALYGGAGFDLATYAGEASGRVANLATGQGPGDDRLAGIEGLVGTGFADGLTGNAGDNLLRGLAGADLLAGGEGRDTLAGGAGNDSLVGGAGVDYAVFAHDRSDYAVATSGGITTVRDLTAGGDGTDRLAGVELLRFADLDLIL